MRLIRGRFLEERDGTEAAPVLVPTKWRLVDSLPIADPLGQQLRFWGVNWTIVGVIGDEKVHGLGNTTPIAAYTPIAQAPPLEVPFCWFAPRETRSIWHRRCAE